MKFLSIFEEQEKILSDDFNYKSSKAYEIVNNEVKKSKLSLFFDAHDMGFDLHKTREESQGLVREFDNLVEELGEDVKNKALVIDTAVEADAGGGGFDGNLIPDFSTIIKVVFVFVIAQSATGFIQEAGKDFYVWIKSKIRGVKYRKTKHVYVVLRGKKREAKFLFQDNFNEEIFNMAWKEMLKINVDKLNIDEFEERIYVFDTKESRWVVFN